MKRLIFIFSFAILGICANAQHLNFDAVEYYFSLTDSLRNDQPISESAWKKLLSFKGVQLYIKNNNLDEQTLKRYKRNFELAYMPRYDSIRTAQLKQKEKYFFIWVFNNYKTQEAELKSYYQNIKQHQKDYLDSLYANCYAMLPKKMHTKANNTTIYFIPLMNDAIAEGNDVVFTLYGAYHFDRLKYGALGGHELHHVLRKNKTNCNPNDTQLYQALTLLLNEGSADLIDKKYTASKDCPEDLVYFEFMMKYGFSTLATLDTAIMAHIDKKTEIQEKDIPNIVPMSGHIPGCYMATIIARNGFKNSIIENIDDPIKFVLLYHKVSKLDKEKCYQISDKTITYISKIKQRRAAKK